MPIQPQTNHAHEVTKYDFRHLSHNMREGAAAMSSSSISLLRVAAVIAFLPLLAACDDHAASATAKPERPVQVQRVAFENEKARRELVGGVRARSETDLGFRVAGKIVSRVVNVGDRVQIGDVVARLDPQDLKLRVESAEAEFPAAPTHLK